MKTETLNSVKSLRNQLKPLVLMSGLATGGAERVTVSFLRQLKSFGITVPLCTLNSRQDGPLADEVANSGIERLDLGAKRLASASVLARYLSLVWNRRFNLVHAHGQDAVILAGMARLPRIPLVATRHVLTEPSDDWRQSTRAWLTDRCFRKASAVVAVCGAVAEHLQQNAAVQRSSIWIIPNGIEIERFAPENLPMSRSETRRELGLEQDDRLVLVVSVLRQGKGHEVLLSSLANIRAAVPRVRIAIVGSGEQEKSLRQQASEFGESVLFLGDRSDIPSLLAACDLAVLPSFSEAFPTTLIEAAAAGKPVVATRVGGTPEVVKDGKTGLLVPPGDCGQLAQAIITLLNDPSLVTEFGEQAKLRARKRFSVEVQVEKTMGLWYEVCQNQEA